MFRPVRLAALAAAVFACSAAQAATITVTGTGTTSADGPLTVTAPQITPAQLMGGVLNSVTITGNVFASGSHNFENLSTNPATINLTHTNAVSLNRPGGAAFLSTVVNLANPPGPTFNLGAFDGTINFGGTSGASFNVPQQNGPTASVTLTGAALAAYIGTGNVTFAGTTSSTSTATGSGNLVSQFQTTGGANVTLVYDFTPAGPPTTTNVPEPASLACFGALLVGGLGYARRKLFA